MSTPMVTRMVTIVPEAFLAAIEVDLWVLGPSRPECRVLDLCGQLVAALPGTGLHTSVPEALHAVTIPEVGIPHHAEVGPRGLSPVPPRAPRRAKRAWRAMRAPSRRPPPAPRAARAGDEIRNEKIRKRYDTAQAKLGRGLAVFGEAGSRLNPPAHLLVVLWAC